MGTTSLYVELIIIGMEVSGWIVSFLTYFLGNRILLSIEGLLKSIPVSIFLLGVFYVFGIVFDRFSDMVFKRLERQIRSKAGIKAESTILIWRENDQEEYFRYARGRIRILRSSTINIPLIACGVCLCYNRYIEGFGSGLIYLICLGLILSAMAYIGYVRSVSSYYRQARIVEKAGHSSKK